MCLGRLEHLWLPCVSGLGGGGKGLAGARAGFTVSLVPQIRKAERDRKTLDWEIGADQQAAGCQEQFINRLEELNVRLLAPRLRRLGPAPTPAGLGSEPACSQERHRRDCNLAVQLLKCNKSHFRNHKFADVSSIPSQPVPTHPF